MLVRDLPSIAPEKFATVGRQLALSPSAPRLQLADAAARVAQITSPCYYFRAHTDQRRISVTGLNVWNWDQFCRDWDAKATAARLGVVPDEVRQLHDSVLHDATVLDPLAQWQDLVRFVAPDRRAQLKGSALLAEEWYQLTSVLGLFYEDLTGQRLDGRGDTELSRQRLGVDSRKAPFEALGYVANRYHLNPQPSLLLIVEGQSESEVLPGLIRRLFGFTPEELGIQLRPVHGISNMTGNQKEAQVGGALRRLVEWAHYNQVIAFVLADRENGIEQAVKGLVAGKFTRRSLVYLWKDCIEYDNFKAPTLAKALNQIAPRSVRFSASSTPGTLAVPADMSALKRLYRQHTGKDLPKVKLLTALCAGIPSSRTRLRLVRVLQRIIDLAARNPLPLRRDVANYNRAWLAGRRPRPLRATR